MIQKCNTASKAVSTQGNKAPAKTGQGRAIAYLEREHTCLTMFEKNMKRTMQDRMKFMSTKNAVRMQAKLCEIDYQKSIVQDAVHMMQKS